MFFKLAYKINAIILVTYTIMMKILHFIKTLNVHKNRSFLGGFYLPMKYNTIIIVKNNMII